MNILKNIFKKKESSLIPIWFMRQAGRYLPEFRNIRSKNPDFIKLCLDSDLSSKLTLQPIERYDLDAAIIFSDILMVPFALNQLVEFKKDFGPVLSDFDNKVFLHNNFDDFSQKLKPVYTSIYKTKKKLDKKKPLIAFIGAPWTLLVYMFKLKTTDNKLDTQKFNYKKKDIKKILEKLNNYLKKHIQNQVDAGADIVQIFDSWAGLIPKKDLNEFCYIPNAELSKFCSSINVPIISFPKGLNQKYAEFVKIVKPSALSIDYNLDPNWALNNLDGVCIQGGMDPKILLKDESYIYKEAEKYLKTFKGYPYIFNLGHGLLPQTNPDNVAKLIKFVRDYK
jgi:uroporphyrinogen decarboxylase